MPASLPSTPAAVQTVSQNASRAYYAAIRPFAAVEGGLAIQPGRPSPPSVVPTLGYVRSAAGARRAKTGRFRARQEVRKDAVFAPQQPAGGAIGLGTIGRPIIRRATIGRLTTGHAFPRRGRSSPVPGLWVAQLVVGQKNLRRKKSPPLRFFSPRFFCEWLHPSKSSMKKNRGGSIFFAGGQKNAPAHFFSPATRHHKKANRLGRRPSFASERSTLRPVRPVCVRAKPAFSRAF